MGSRFVMSKLFVLQGIAIMSRGENSRKIGGNSSGRYIACAGITACDLNPAILKYISNFKPNTLTQAHTKDRD